MADILKPCIKQIFNQREVSGPLFQVVEIREAQSKDGNSLRYKFAINDGTNYCTAMLSSQLNNLVIDKQLELYQIIKALDYNVFESKKAIILLEIQVLPEKYNEVIGDPSPLNPKGTANKKEPSANNQQSETELNVPQQNHNESSSALAHKKESMPVVAPPPSTKPKPARPTQASTQYLSIASLTMYITSWTIQARVVQKGPLKEWVKQTSRGVHFFVVLKDKAGDEIRGTFWNDQAQEYFDKIELDKVYIVSGGRIKPTNPKYSSVKHEYEITFDRSTKFIEDPEGENQSIGDISYDFVKLKDIGNKEDKSLIDVLAVVSEVRPVDEFHSYKLNKDLKKRVFLCTDDSNAVIECTLWNDEALNFPTECVGQVIRIKNASVNEYHGKSISTTSSSVIKFLDSSDPQASGLYQWYESNKDNIDSLDNISKGTGGGQYNSQMIYLDQINTENLGKGENADYFSTYVILKDIFAGRNLYYLSCPNPECKHKGVSLEGDKYICPRCKKVIDEPYPNYSFSAQFWDYSGKAYFTVMGDEIGKVVLGMPSEEWKEKTDGAEENEKTNLIRPLCFKHFKIRGRAKTDTYNNEERVKLFISAVSEVDYADAAKFYAGEISKF